MILFEGKYTTAKVMIDEIDEATLSQIVSFINNEAFTQPVSVMPDCHAGEGAVIGFTMPLGDKLPPAIVGYDINCGMLLVIFPFKRHNMTISRESLDQLIRERIPFGQEVHKYTLYNMEKSFPWDIANHQNLKFCKEFNQRFNANMQPTHYNYEWFENKCKSIGMNITRCVRSLGTLGGGNHFIEFSESEKTGNICLTIHTGSRQFGKKICQYWMGAPLRRRQEEIQKQFQEGLAEIKETYKNNHHKIPYAIKKLRSELGMNNKVPKTLQYLEGEDLQGYLTDMIFAETYATENRHIISDIIINEILSANYPVLDVIETVHNYIDFNDFIIRKGAISAHKDELMIIPLNMEDGSLICKGKDNSDWNYSAPHGAGRLYARGKAKKKFDSKSIQTRMNNKGIYTSAVPADEVKEAYKDPKVIEEAIGPTAEIVDRLIPILNLKEGNEKREKDLSKFPK